MLPASASPVGGAESGRDASRRRGSSRTSQLDAAGRPELRPAGDAAAEEILKTFNTWHFKRERPSDQSLMLRVIAGAMTIGAPLPFVLYWGKGPRSHVADPDVRCLDFLKELTTRVGSVYPRGAALTLIQTDTHARLNGHSEESIERYFREITEVARRFGYSTCRLGELVNLAPFVDLAAELTAPDDVLAELCASAVKWYRGEGTAEQGARRYFRMNMLERRAVEAAFPGATFITFNGSRMRPLFPEKMPIFYMYSLRRGFGVKPWFLAGDPIGDVGHPNLCPSV